MKLYFKYLKNQFRIQMQYKVSFILSFISQIFIFLTYYFSVICLFDKFSNIKGFTKYEVLLTLGIIQLGASFTEGFFRGMDQFDNLIIKGSFDKILVRPRNIILQIFGEEINFIKLSKVIQAIILIIISVINIGIDWDIYHVLTLLFMIIGSIVLFLCVLILAAAYCFLTVKGLEVRNVVTCGCRDMAQYPIGIFKKGIAFVLTYIFPFAMINYYPLLYFIDRSSSILYVFAPLITIVYLIPCIVIFYKGIKRYTSVGC